MPLSSFGSGRAAPLHIKQISLSNRPAIDAAAASQHADVDQHAILERVYRSEAPRLKRYFKRRVAEPDDAADLVQESFVRLASQMCRGVLSHPASYLQRIARNLWYDTAKNAAAKLASADIPTHDALAIAVEPDQCHAIEGQDLMEMYRVALETLPDRTRSVFLLHRVEELPYREISVRLGISVPTVQYHFAKALVHIATALDLR